MSFTLAALIVVALVTVVLGLVCYHLLSRLELLERAVSGGLEAPTRRLTRHEFEQRFDRALARSRLAEQVGDGLVIAVGAEYPGSDLSRMLAHLPRADGVVLAPIHDAARTHIDGQSLAGVRVVEPWAQLGLTVTPMVFVVDDRRIRHSQPVTSADELLELIRIST